MQSIATFLMFVGDHHGKAEEAAEFYTSVFKRSEVLSIDRWGPHEIESEGTVKSARFTLNGVEFRAMDSAFAHAFTFTPAISLFVECESKEELEFAYAKLIEGGEALMPIGDYGFSKRFGWVQDKYGVSWQLNLS